MVVFTLKYYAIKVYLERRMVLAEKELNVGPTSYCDVVPMEVGGRRS